MKRQVKHALFVQFVAVPLFYAMGCGEPQFTDGSGSQKLQTSDSKVATPSDQPSIPEQDPGSTTDTGSKPGVPSIAKATSLTWFWSCDSASLPQPTFPKDEDLMKGVGPHNLSAGRYADVPIVVRSQICPVDQSRDIVFVVDVSGSMNLAANGNDPKTNGTCNRLEAVKQVIAATGSANGGKFAVVTFSDSTNFASTAFSSTLDGALGGSDAATVICDANGGTNYKDPLVQVQTLLTQARQGASREVYFISDGVPDNDGSGNGPNNAAINGKVESKALRDAGVFVATVMLGNNAAGDAYMRSFIASTVKQTGGQDIVMHASVANTNDLTRVLSQLSSNDIATGQFKYRSVGATEWQIVDLMKYRKDGEFQLPALTINPAVSPNGVEIEITYSDRRNVTHDTGGKFAWIVTEQ